MHVVEASSGEKFKIVVEALRYVDVKNLKEERYFFDWSKERSYEVYKLTIRGSSEILGLLSLERIPSEWRIHIRLLSVSIENQGKNKIFDKIAGNLIAYAAQIAVADYAELACLSLRPKSRLAKHYISKYNMTVTGLTLSIEVPEILNLINTYDHDD